MYSPNEMISVSSCRAVQMFIDMLISPFRQLYSISFLLLSRLVDTYVLFCFVPGSLRLVMLSLWSMLDENMLVYMFIEGH